MRATTASSLLLLAGCATPDEVQDKQREAIHEMAPLLEQAAAVKALELIAQKYAPWIERVEKDVTKGDDAVRRALKEAVRDAEIDRSNIRAENMRQHSVLRDAIDRNRAASEASDKQFVRDLSKLGGRVDGTDEAIQQKAGIAQGVLLQANIQMAQMQNLARENQTRHNVRDADLKEWKKKALTDLATQAKDREDKRWDAVLADVWSWASDLAWVATSIAGVLIAAITWLTVRGAKKKKEES
jgi:hypothetical protein